MLTWLSKPRILWINLIFFIGLSLAFAGVMWGWNFQIIDELWQADKIIAHLDGFTAQQKRVHILITATLDVAYPFVYGALFTGALYRFYPRMGRYFIWLPLLCIPADLIEGISQLILLSADMSGEALRGSGALQVKLICTPIKLALFTLALLLSFWGLIKAIYSRKTKLAR